MMPRLKKHFQEALRPQIQKDLGLSCSLAVPRLKKIVLNAGLGRRIAQDNKLLQSASEDLALIAGQKPLITLARKSIAAFKVRVGMPAGLKVTLRGDRMYDFLDRLLTMAMPRMSNYRGATPRLDGRGNYALGIPDRSIFYEIDYSRVSYSMGLDVIFVTTASSDKAGYCLLKGLGVPFTQEGGLHG